MQEHLEETHDPRLVDLEAGVTDRADADRTGEAMDEREVDVDVEPLGPVTGEAVGDRLEGGAHGLEMIEPLPHFLSNRGRFPGQAFSLVQG
jgi:hypothetical protein